MYYNPSYMNPIAQKPMQQEFSQQPNQEPLEGIASLAPTQPSQPTPTQPIPPQMTPPPGGIQPIAPPLKTLQPGIIDPKIIDPNFSPYARNENLDLTDRAGIMGEYRNYLRGGHGYQGPTPMVSTMADFMGEEMSIGYHNNFGKFLDTFGIRDRLQFPTNQQIVSTNQAPLQQIGQGGPGFRQEGDMGRYVAFNDPGQPGAGYSNYQDYLSAGNEPVSSGGIASLADYQSQQNTGPGI
jgi:hypothetical protein